VCAISVSEVDPCAGSLLRRLRPNESLEGSLGGNRMKLMIS